MKKYLNLIIFIISIIIYFLVMFIFNINLGTGKKELENILVLVFPVLTMLFYLIYYEKDKKIIIYYLIMYFVMLIGFVFFSSRASYLTTNKILLRNYNIIPFIGIIKLFKTSKSFALYNILGNFLMLSPLAILLPIVCKKFENIKYFSLFILILTLTIESVQYFTNIGSFDIDDIILNISGVIITFLIVYNTRLKKIIYDLFFEKKSEIIMFKFLYYVFLSLSFIVFLYYAFLILNNIYENKVNYSNLKCVEENKTYLTSINNYRYYSLCKYSGNVKKGKNNYSLKDSILNNFFNEKDLKKLNIVKEKIVTDVRLISDTKINEIFLNENTYYLVNMKDIIYTIDGTQISLNQASKDYDFNPILSLVKISYFAENKIMSVYEGEYFNVINCSDNKYFVLDKNFKYDYNFCSK